MHVVSKATSITAEWINIHIIHRECEEVDLHCSHNAGMDVPKQSPHIQHIQTHAHDFKTRPGNGNSKSWLFDGSGQKWQLLFLQETLGLHFSRFEGFSGISATLESRLP